MKFGVAGREVDVGFGHLLLVFGVNILVLAALAFISGAIALVSGRTDFVSSFLKANIRVDSIFALVGVPVIAYLLLECGRVVKMKIDTAFFRSAAAATFIITAGIYVLFMGLFIAISLMPVPGQYQYGSGLSSILPLFGLPYIAGIVLSLASSAILTFLWLLLFAEPKGGRLEKASVFALIFASGMLLFDEAVRFFADYAAGVPHELSIGVALAWPFVRYFIFALPLLYHTIGKKLDMEAAWLFAGLYLGGTVFFVANNALIPVEPGAMLADLSGAVVSLALVYALSRTKGISL